MAAAAFRPREPRLPTVLQLAADWYWETDAAHVLTRRELSPRYGRTRELLTGVRPWEMAGADAGQPHWRAQRERMERHERFQDFAATLVDRAGRAVHVLVSGEPVFRRGRFAGYRGVARDVTAQKEAEQALNASESQLAAIIDAAMDAVITVDAQGRVVVFNECASRMLACPRAEAIGAPLARFVPQAMAFIAGPAARGAWPSAGHAPRLLVRSLPVTGQRAGGGFPAEASITRIEMEARVLYCVVLRDVSERNAAESARQALEQQLRQSQKMEALGTMAGGIAHDFNNIVAAILGNAALASAADEPQSMRRFIAEITKAGLRARDAVQRIMAFSRNQAAVFTCQPLQPLVEEGVQLLRAMLPSGIEVACRLPDAPVYVRADAAQVSQVLMNLGTNAWQALGSHPGWVRIELATTGGNEARLTVSDTGCGMDEVTVQRIFEPFFTTKPKGEGTGLGLPVVHGIVRAHGGRIEVRSTRGTGTTFEIFLPLAPPGECDEPAAPAPARALPGAAQGHGRHVVFLDDYPAMVFMMKAMLEGLGFRVSGFEDAPAALAFLREHAADVDLLVSDYNMPGCSGLELAAQALALRADLPVILASGYITDELREGAAALGVAHLFDKPRGIEELCGLIAQVLAPQESPHE